MHEKGRQTWKRVIKEGKFRLEARMIAYDHGVGKYEYANPIDSEWESKCIFVLADEATSRRWVGK